MKLLWATLLQHGLIPLALTCVIAPLAWAQSFSPFPNYPAVELLGYDPGSHRLCYLLSWLNGNSDGSADSVRTLQWFPLDGTSPQQPAEGLKRYQAGLPEEEELLTEVRALRRTCVRLEPVRTSGREFHLEATTHYSTFHDDYSLTYYRFHLDLEGWAADFDDDRDESRILLRVRALFSIPGRKERLAVIDRPAERYGSPPFQSGWSEPELVLLLMAKKTPPARILGPIR